MANRLALFIPKLSLSACFYIDTEIINSTGRRLLIDCASTAIDSIIGVMVVLGFAYGSERE